MFCRGGVPSTPSMLHTCTHFSNITRSSAPDQACLTAEAGTTGLRDGRGAYYFGRRMCLLTEVQLPPEQREVMRAMCAKGSGPIVSAP